MLSCNIITIPYLQKHFEVSLNFRVGPSPPGKASASSVHAGNVSSVRMARAGVNTRGALARHRQRSLGDFNLGRLTGLLNLFAVRLMQRPILLLTILAAVKDLLATRTVLQIGKHSEAGCA